MNYNPKWVHREHSNGPQVFYKKQLITYEWPLINGGTVKKEVWSLLKLLTYTVSVTQSIFLDFTLQREEAAEKQHMCIQSEY